MKTSKPVLFTYENGMQNNLIVIMMIILYTHPHIYTYRVLFPHEDDENLGKLCSNV